MLIFFLNFKNLTKIDYKYKSLITKNLNFHFVNYLDYIIKTSY
jgi:hypothetical protein